MRIPTVVERKMLMISNDPLFQKIVETCIDVLNQYELTIHPQHWQFFLVHLKELAERVIHDQWDIAMVIDQFPPVSEQAMALAKEIGTVLDVIPESELHLLAVHFGLAISTEDDTIGAISAEPFL